MPVIPVGGNSPATWNADLADILAKMNAAGDTQLAQAFQGFAVGFHVQYPGYTARQALSAFLDTELGQSLASTIGQTGGVLGGIPGAAVQGGGKAIYNLTHPLNLLGDALGLHGDFRHLMLRVVEVVLGGILVIVALEEVMKATGSNNIVQGVKKYGKMVK